MKNMNFEKAINEIINAEKQEEYNLSEKLISDLSKSMQIKIKIDDDANIFLERNDIKINIIFDSARYSRKYNYDIYHKNKFLKRIYFKDFYKEIYNIFEIMNNIEYAEDKENYLRSEKELKEIRAKELRDE